MLPCVPGQQSGLYLQCVMMICRPAHLLPDKNISRQHAEIAFNFLNGEHWKERMCAGFSFPLFDADRPCAAPA